MLQALSIFSNGTLSLMISITLVTQTVILQAA
jgi:hypothetical protein